MGRNNFQYNYFESGEIKTKYLVEEGKIEGEVTEYYKTGEIKSISNFKNGVQDGKTQFYYESGNLEREIYFKNGIQEDSMKVFYPNNKIKELSYLVGGVKQNTYLSFYESGEVESAGELINGYRRGEWQFNNTDGSLDYYGYFFDGKETSRLSLIDSSNWSYINHASGYSLVLPRIWKKVRDEQNLVLFVNSKLNNEDWTESINVIIKDTSKLGYINFADIELKQIEASVKNFKITDRKGVSIGSDVSALQVQYEATYNEKELISTSVYTSHNDKLITLTFICKKEDLEKFIPVFRDIISSFVLK